MVVASGMGAVFRLPFIAKCQKRAKLKASFRLGPLMAAILHSSVSVLEHSGLTEAWALTFPPQLPLRSHTVQACSGLGTPMRAPSPLMYLARCEHWFLICAEEGMFGR